MFPRIIDVVIQLGYLRVIVEILGRIEGQHVEVQTKIGRQEGIVAGGKLLQITGHVRGFADVERIDLGNFGRRQRDGSGDAY